MHNIKNQTLLSCLVDKSHQQAIEVFNPSNEQVLGYIASDSSKKIEQVIETAYEAQKQWRTLPAKNRSDCLQKWYQLLLDNKDDLALLMTLEQGKPLAESMGEVKYGASFVQWFAEEAKRAYGETIPAPSSDKRIMTMKQPVGVAAAITPWNFPLAMITRKAAPALAAGCAFIVKPAIQTPLSAHAVVELAHQAGIPQELLTLVNSTDAAMVGKLFCSHPKVAKLSFTGSTRVGKVLLSQSAQTVQKVSMELGGNAPFIVFDDADIDKAVQGAVSSKFRNAGQTCVCANRFYVQERVYEEFVTKFVEAVDQLKVGCGLDSDTDIGPIIDDTAKKNITEIVNLARLQGATLASKPNEQGGLFLGPVVLTNVTQGMDIVQQEIFGPVAPIIKFSEDDELIKLANDTIYGLASYFYSNNINRVWKISEALEYGMVGINEGIISTEVAPFGGVKESGIGREGAKQGLEEYLETKYLCFGGLN